MRRTVEDVMTKTVVVVPESARYKEIVRLMDEHRVTALPVLDEAGTLRGIVSEADLLLKEEYPPPNEDRPHIRPRARRDRGKASGATARELMTRLVFTVEPSATLARAARLMHKHRVKRLPVVDQSGKLVGIVSRSDLLSVFLRTDAEIKDEIEKRVLGGTMWLEQGRVRVAVDEGTVYLDGQVHHRSNVPLVVGLVYQVDGVVSVDERLTWEVDDIDQWAAAPGPHGVLRARLR